MSSTNKTNYSYTKSEIDSMGGGVVAERHYFPKS